MESPQERDYFSDLSVLKDPYAFFETIRAHGPVYQSQIHDIVFVTGFAEALEVLNNTADFLGAHACIGNPLARAEVRVILDRLLEHTSEIRLSEEHHGPVGKRRLDYEPSFIIRGLERLYLEVEPRK